MTDHAEEHLRRFVAARRAGDERAMRRWWDELVIDVFDRMDGFVAVAHRGRLDNDEHELAVAMAMERFAHRLIATFNGTSIGELVNATRTLAQRICIDVQRASVRAHRHDGPSLDAPPEDGGSWDAAEASRRYDDQQRASDTRQFLDWALPQLKPERRQVLELTFAGAELPEIVTELGISRDNVYQRRTRAMKDLAKLKDRYDA
ncbi:RNA polymerase sigma factor [Solirubrobacter pauli]|nr:sigma factor-like helix-turn-helix DNA-binding protein [Solirubrobacter pauli]